VGPCCHLSHMWNVADRRGCGALWRAAILSRRSIQDDTVIIPLSRGGGEVLESDDLLWCGRPRSLRGQTSPRETYPSWGGGGVSSGVRVIMKIMCVRVVEFLC
jgi:hypothetical protein